MANNSTLVIENTKSNIITKETKSNHKDLAH